MSVNREQALEVFSTSRKSATAVGLRIKGRSNLLITNLENVSGTNAESTVLVVGPESIYGEPLRTTSFFLDDIDQIFNLRIRFNDPFYEYLRSLRTNVRIIREATGAW